jgi:hypothetical protein
MTITQYRKEIVYDRETRDYAYYLDGELAGFARTYYEAEVALDQLVYNLLKAQPIADEPAQPDLATDLYNVVCLTLSGAGAATSISELRRVAARYEKEMRK